MFRLMTEGMIGECRSLPDGQAIVDFLWTMITVDIYGCAGAESTVQVLDIDYEIPRECSFKAMRRTARQKGLETDGADDRT